LLLLFAATKFRSSTCSKIQLTLQVAFFIPRQ